MAREAAAWHEGYATALHDFDIRVTDEQIPNLSRNPHGGHLDTSLTEYERAEIRQALSYHFEDCPGEWDLQAEIVSTIVERILSRRPGRA
jgi:hypothetical protein